ncbi:MAG: hypothetical protein A3D35_01605 [Candidatus Staskawiczbacteria bacterium RIFCSPHIGHO2_02_FULL_34_9]|uniref:R3H domain-containing protein n=1 Tax=Candidatus Staskawiczbacteria bacterium RIFCSPHIGHO2_02_FULL_34_9 TaxID=1802206 RepID=A0A1G2HWU4_9BACT|nr:MAG: hypothetical protein A3D35_01605 [Candidatus Staskawiczbacteria bacterium RIFCSPHIGHO2_02_FULL_34_9]
MITQEEVQIIKEITNEFLSKMTMGGFAISLETSIIEDKDGGVAHDFISVNIEMQDPKFLIGQNGKNLVELERIIRMILNKKLQKNIYFKLDINNYQKNKIEYLKKLAKESAEEVILTKKSKVLPPMSSYERRIIHTELAERQDIITESQGDGPDKNITIRLR